MKLTLTALALIIAANAPAFAGDVAYVDMDGCTHTPILGASGSALYWNLGLEPGCGRVTADGGALAELARERAKEEEK